MKSSIILSFIPNFIKLKIFPNKFLEFTTDKYSKYKLVYI